MKYQYPLRSFLVFFLMAATFLNCSRKELDIYARPEGLEPPIYQQLQAKKKFSTLLQVIDKSGYQRTLSSAGYDSTLSIENSLIEESALELAYEGQRRGDLVRVDLRRNDPAFLADKVYLKLKKANNPNAEAVRAKLLVSSNWYLPFKLK